MSAWSDSGYAFGGRAPASWPGGSLSLRRPKLGPILLCGGLICVLIAQGMAITHSYLWAAPLICLLLIAVAVDIPLVPFVGAALLFRVLTDDLASSASRQTGSLNPSALIAVLLILIAIGLLIRWRQALWPALAIGLWLAVWTGVAILADGASTVTIREGMREASIVALAFIVFNSRGALNLSVVTRIVQVAGFVSALLAIYQLGTHSGDYVGGVVRAHGTFAHPNDAAVYFAVATLASLWQYIDNGRRWQDLALTGLFSAAVLSTYSLDGFLSLIVMVTAFGVLRTGSKRLRLGVCVAIGVLVTVFLATPLGAERIASESSTEIGSAHVRGSAPNSSLAWRLHKWEALIPEWEKAPVFGRGLGTIVSEEEPTAGGTGSVLPHNEYVRYLVETGGLGIIVLLSGLWILIRRLRRGRHTCASQNAATLGLALLSGLLVNALAANTLLYTPAAYAAVLILSGALIASRIPSVPGVATEGIE